jgi:hypothetical protein
MGGCYPTQGSPLAPRPNPNAYRYKSIFGFIAIPNELTSVRRKSKIVSRATLGSLF